MWFVISPAGPVCYLVCAGGTDDDRRQVSDKLRFANESADGDFEVIAVTSL